MRPDFVLFRACPLCLFTSRAVEHKVVMIRAIKWMNVITDVDMQDVTIGVSVMSRHDLFRIWSREYR
jgi:hypothetical protein